MKRLVYLLAIFVLVTTSGFALKQRVVINGMTGEMKPVLAPAQTMAPIKCGNIESASSMQAVENQTFDNAGTLPAIIRAEETFRVRVNFARDTSDTAMVLKSRTTEEATWVGMFQYPSNMGSFGTAAGVAQFVPGLPGKFVLDTMVLVMYKPSWVKAAVKNDYQLIPVSVPSINMNDTAALRKSNGIIFDFGGNNFEYLASDYIYLNKDSLNNRLFEMNGQSYIKYTIVGLETPIEIAKNKNFGIVCFQESDPSSQDTMLFQATFEWNLSPYQTYGCMLRRNGGRDTVNSFYNYVWNMTADGKIKYPSMDRQSIRQDFEISFYGEITVDTEVEELNNEASAFSLDGISPNPVNDITNFNFSLDKTTPVSLAVYNTMGQKVSEITNKTYTPGTYKVTFDATSLPVGSYFVTLMSGKNTASRVMQVVR
jgi:hypothetical protein